MSGVATPMLLFSENAVASLLVTVPDFYVTIATKTFPILSCSSHTAVRGFADGTELDLLKTCVKGARGLFHVYERESS